jgi:ATP-dependent RNA helicase RhlE
MSATGGDPIVAGNAVGNAPGQQGLPTVTSFSTLGLSPALCTTLDRLDYRTPTPIQAAAIPIVMRGGDLVARAHTGTGKTAAFGLPIVERLCKRPGTGSRRTPRALVLVPTRELAVQVHRALMAFAAAHPLRVTAIVGGAAMREQTRALQRGVDVVVATPGRLIDLLDRRCIDLSAVEVLTLDEADRMLDMGFQPALRRLIPALPATRQTLLFSATMSAAVTSLTSAFTRDAARLDISGGEPVAPTVTHQVQVVAADQKRAALTRLLTDAGSAQTLVFCKTKRGSDRVGEHLDRAGINAAVIHGDKTQGARSRALDAFRHGRVTVLVATDIAARGLDIAHLPLVVNFDLPLVPEDYVHRIGRTGRAGREGRAVSLMSPADAPLLREIQRLLPAPMALTDASGAPAALGVAFAPGPLGARAPRPRGAGPSARPHGGRFGYGSRGPRRDGRGATPSARGSVTA